VLALARSTEDRTLIQLGYFHLVAVHAWRGEAEILIPFAKAGIEISKEIDNLFVAGAADVMKTWAEATLGGISGDAARMAEALERWEALEFGVWTPAFVGRLAELHVLEGHADDAIGLVDNTLVRIAESGERQFESPLLGIRGDALLAGGSAGNAEDCYRHALEIARGQSAKSWELRAATRLARLWHSQGKTPEARDLLAPIYGWFTEGFDTADLKDAKTLLDKLA
jgi:predicted ATPase